MEDECTCGRGNTRQFCLVNRSTTWHDALAACPTICPTWSLAAVYDERDFSTLARRLQSDYPESSFNNGIHEGAWIALNAVHGGGGTAPGHATAATGWRWARGTDPDGPFASSAQLQHWGGPGTGFGGKHGDLSYAAAFVMHTLPRLTSLKHFHWT